MIKRSLRGLLLAAMVACVPAALAANPAAPAVPVAVDDAATILQQAGIAQRTTDFRGRFVYVRGNHTESMQVVHAFIDGVEHERLSHLDDSAAEIIRRGNDVVLVHPDAQQTRMDGIIGQSPFRQFSALGADVARNYLVRRVGASRVAGRMAETLEVAPRDAHRYGYRLWLDQTTRLPLRYEIFGIKGRRLESVQFVDIETGISIPKALFEPPGGAPVRALAVEPADDATRDIPPVAPGWLPPGFAPAGRELRRFAAGGPLVSSQSFDDGLAMFTLFVEPAGKGARPLGVRQVGPTVAISGVLNAGSHGRFLVTLVGEVPPVTAMKIVESTRYGAQRAERGP